MPSQPEKWLLLIHHFEDRFLAGLRAPLRALLVQVAGVAVEMNTPIWLVGGVVRDLLLGRPITYDVDLAVEGDAVALAHALTAALGGHVCAQHQAFGTATVELTPPQADHAAASKPVMLDLAGTRTERYPQPAALPVVQASSIEQDLQRRDFSFNALALEVQASGERLHFGRLLDPCEGQQDLQAGVLRVLHDHSFTDDPTRMLRGLRLAVRLGLRFEPHTLALLEHALASGSLEATSPDRIRTELCLMLAEPDPVQVLQHANSLGITAHIFDPLERMASLLSSVEMDALPPLERAGVLTYELTMEEREAFIARYRLSGDAARLLRDIGALRGQLEQLRQPVLRNSDLYNLLRPYSGMALDVVRYLELGEAGARISYYFNELQHVAPLLNGHALQQLGVPPGPLLGALLAGLRAARLDGLVVTRADEEAWVRQHSAA
jgi:tRNA nucleotidyltransferase (CCA-adding enzyme)